jgi:hypothetical protein
MTTLLEKTGVSMEITGQLLLGSGVGNASKSGGAILVSPFLTSL